MRRFPWYIACLALMTVCAGAREPDATKLPIAWFEGPDRHAPHWRVDFEHPELSYSQRMFVGVRAIVPVNEREHRPDWHIVLRIADEKGRWIQDYAYHRLDLRSRAAGDEPVALSESAFVRPGSYRLALLAYDAVSKNRFAWHKTERVSRAKILPDIDRDLPKVEFVHADRPPPSFPEYLPVRTHSPVRIDIIFNLTPNLQLSTRPDYFDRIRPSVAETIRETAEVFSQMSPSRGCVRVSAIDVLRLETVLDRSARDPDTNVQQIEEHMPTARDGATIDVHTLSGRSKASEFLHQFLDSIVRDHSGCSKDVANPHRAIIVVSDSLIFPLHSEKEPISPGDEEDALVFHVRFSYTESTILDAATITRRRLRATSGVITSFDELGHMLEPLRPHRFDVKEPKDLRHALASIVSEIEAVSAVSALHD